MNTFKLLSIFLTYNLYVALCRGKDLCDYGSCGPGTFINATGKCERCPRGWYLEQQNHSCQTCRGCRAPTEGSMEIVIRECNATHDTVIGCVAGFSFLHEMCKPISGSQNAQGNKLSFLEILISKNTTASQQSTLSTQPVMSEVSTPSPAPAMETGDQAKMNEGNKMLLALGVPILGLFCGLGLSLLILLIARKTKLL